MKLERLIPVPDKPAVIGKRLRRSHIWSRDADDFYVEPQWVNERLFAAEDFGRDRILLDPCCGTGRIATAARAFGYKVKACDIVDRGFSSTRVEDFLERRSLAAGSVVGNPPFNLVQMFARHALLDLHAAKVALVFPVARLNAAHRWLKDLPLRRVWLLTPRPSMPPGHVIARGEKPGGGKVDFAWLVFEHGYAGSAELAWLHRDGKTSCSQKR
jgi:hypothetical protein